MAKRRVSKKGSKKPKTKRSVKRVKKNMGASVRAAIKDIAASNVETKEFYDTSTAYTQLYFNSGMTAAGDSYFLLNGILPGTEDYQRIGDKINLLSCTVAGNITIYAPFSAQSPKAIGVRMYILNYKRNPSSTSPLTAADLLNFNGGAVAFTGAPINLNMDINTDSWTVLAKKTIWLKDAINVISGSATSQDGTFQRPFKMKFGKHIVKYTNGTNLPATFNPFFCMGYIYSDNSGTIDTVSQQLSATWMTKIYFKDA